MEGQLAMRAKVIDVAQCISRTGLSPGRSGNVSARWGDGMLITPSGMAYSSLEPRDIVLLDLSGAAAPGQRKPSSEWHFHAAIYKARADRHAVVHTHSNYATVLACAHKAIPAFHYMVAVAGGNDIPCVPYATFGTQDLAEHIVVGLKERDACLMANHGQVAVAKSPEAALELAQEVEVLAAQYFKVLSLGSEHFLQDDEMAIVLDKFRTYGQLAQD